MIIDQYYMIFNVSELNKIDFDEIKETSPEFMVYSLNKTKTFVKWQGDTIPSCLETLTTKEGPYTHYEILEILGTSEWSEPFVFFENT